MRWAKALMLVAMVCVAPGAAEAGDVGAAQAAVDEAGQALTARRYADAASLMEKAFTLDPNPLWLANAGYAHLMAGQHDAAVKTLTAALADQGFKGDPRTRASERLVTAKTVQALAGRAATARQAGDLAGAARAYDDAFSALPIGPYALEAGRLWESAKSWRAAEERYTSALAAQDLPPEPQQEAAIALARVARLAADDSVTGPDDGGKPDDPRTGDGAQPREPEVPPEGGRSPVLGWVLVGTGAAALAAGVVVLVVGNGKASDLADAQGRAEEGRVSDMTRSEALTLAADAETFQTAGLVTALVGGAVAVTGAVLVATSGPSTPATDGRVDVGASIVRDGLMLSFGGTW